MSDRSMPPTSLTSIRLRASRNTLRAHILAALGVAGCSQVPRPTSSSDGKQYDAIDRDQDGYSAQVDCNDNDASIHPEADEACNALDDNCNGLVDEDVRLVYYRDADGDTYGNPTDALAACSLPDGYVQNDDDCNDASDAAHPGGEEVCDGLDNDCDGSTDDIPGYWPDLDGDGFGGTGEPVTVCEPMPEGYADNQADCDDADEAINPDEPEHCFDAKDNNCDGLLSCVMVDVEEEDSGAWCSITWAIEDAQASSWESFPCEGCDYTFDANLELSEVLGDSTLCADAGDLSSLFEVQGSRMVGALDQFTADGWVGYGAFDGGILTWYGDENRLPLADGGYFRLSYGGELLTMEVQDYYYGYYGYYEGRPLSVDGAHVVAVACARADWSRSGGHVDGAGLTDAERSQAIAEWTRAGLAEHASVASFNRFVMELMSLGAPPDLIMESLQAAQDEVIHARDSFSVASGLAGRPIGPGSLDVTGVLEDMTVEGAPLRLLSEGCVEETLSTALAAHRLVHCRPGPIRATLERIVADETRHAALAWRSARWILTTHPHLRPLARKTLRAAMALPQPAEGGAVSSALRAVGVTSRTERARERQRTLTDVVEPAVQALFAGWSPSEVELRV